MTKRTEQQLADHIVYLFKIYLQRLPKDESYYYDDLCCRIRRTAGCTTVISPRLMNESFDRVDCAKVTPSVDGDLVSWIDPDSIYYEEND